jgi:predicted HicB family RNase H-like nuclease
MNGLLPLKVVGRPPRHKGERLSKNRTFRVRGGLDEQLRAAADASGRSVSEEIEYRLQESFRLDKARSRT